VTLTDRIVAALAGLGQAAAGYNVSELIEGSAIVRFENTYDVAATQKALEQAGLMGRAARLSLAPDLECRRNRR
jgi:hypothetical protein